MQNFDAAFAYIDALSGGNANSELVDFRAIHDTRKDIPAIPFRGTVRDCWSSIVHYNNQGYGVFACINAMDGNGRELANVAHIRAHCVDLDNLSAEQNYQAAARSQPAPSFAVNSSPGKYHVYWSVEPYAGNDYFSLIQRKLKQVFDGDPTIIDASRVMRLPGTLHLKGEPFLVTCWALAGFGQRSPVTVLEAALQHINVTDGGAGTRHDLGEPSLAAPSIDWIAYALNNTDPNEMDRGEWISFTSAIKQAAWNTGTPEQIFQLWSDWCARYTDNDPGENQKQWDSIRQTEIGWPSVVRRVPSIRAWLLFKGQQHGTGDVTPPDSTPAPETPQSPPPMPEAPPIDCSGEILTAEEQKHWFAGCFFVENFGDILTPSGRLMNATKFNGAYGGKQFIINSNAKTVNEAWQAATRSTLWTVPKVDHLRFVPQSAQGEIIVDELGRKGVNTYKPALIERMSGDPTPFLNHMALLLPVESDRKIILDFMAHNTRFPGFKIPWAPLIQSAEGVGKGIIKAIMRHNMGGPYVHFPNAQELTDSGSKFNAWMRAKLFILVDEIKVDERRDMIEILKPMISEPEIEIQGKGNDQDKEDNYSNWMFFSNYKDAIPINKNGRRFSIFYSAIQSIEDIRMRGMDDKYFDNLREWFGINEGNTHKTGLKIVADFLHNYPVERGKIPMRAPDTSSTAEAMRQSLGPIEVTILNAIDDQAPGFRGGFVSVLAVMNRLKQAGGRQPAQRTVEKILETLGYVYIGRSVRAYFQENAGERSALYHTDRNADISTYGAWQGYE